MASGWRFCPWEVDENGEVKGMDRSFIMNIEVGKEYRQASGNVGLPSFVIFLWIEVMSKLLSFCPMRGKEIDISLTVDTIVASSCSSR